jgi:hypothetical protein
MVAGELRFRLLTHAVTVTCDAPAALAALRFLAQDAEQAGQADYHLRYQVAALAGERFAVALDGLAIGTALHVDGVLDLVHASLHEAVSGSMPPHARIHAGLATIAGRRVLFVGRKGAGKTTLMLQLLTEGIEVLADELVLLGEDGMATPWPRRFHARDGSFRLVPGLAPLLPDLPAQTDPDGNRVRAVSPGDLGRPWRIAPAPVDDVVFLRPAHGEASTIRPLDKQRATRRLLRQTTLPDRSMAWAGRILALIHCSRTHLLYTGAPRESAALVRNLFGISEVAQGCNP